MSEVDEVPAGESASRIDVDVSNALWGDTVEGWMTSK